MYMSSDISIKFAQKLKKLRKEKGYSQEELAFLCDLDRTYIGRLENLKRNPTLPVMDKIAKAFNMEISEMLDFKE